jgi:1-deoxyxylulose-5-phosphate synthase
VALAWMLRNRDHPPIVCAGKPQHLDDAIAVVELQLSNEAIAPVSQR